MGKIKAQGKEATGVFKFLKTYLSLAQVQKLSKSVKAQPDLDSMLARLEQIAMRVARVKGVTPSRKIIAKEGQEILLYSKDKTKVLGRFPFGSGNKYKNERTARTAASLRERQIQFFKRQKADAQLILTLKEMMAIDEDLGEAMAVARVKQFSVGNIPPHLLTSLCKKFGPDSGFHGRCTTGISDKVTDKPAFCAWLHKACHDKWPAEGES